jgi:sterol desaturase/sphingolipid hydroxylase (fatty acid hydroxylase superfamily)
MSTRQDILLFTFATLKTVDDHCGYSLPFDPLQLLFSNNADFHDIHHQTIGIKKNFSQPFFIHWDTIMGTRMTRKDIADAQAKRTQRTPSANGAANANGDANGDTNGCTNGRTNVRTNGHGKPIHEKEKVQ